LLDAHYGHTEAKDMVTRLLDGCRTAQAESETDGGAAGVTGHNVLE
jgi:hypothetical protein